MRNCYRFFFICVSLASVIYVLASCYSVSFPEPLKPPFNARLYFESQVSALVKVHKRADIAVRAAFSVYDLYPHMEIVMIDDSPSPITQPLPPTVRYIRIAENTGISYGRNHGVNSTYTKYIFLMDDDWLLTNTSNLQEAFDLLQANHSIDIVAGFLCKQNPLNDCYGYEGSIGIVDGFLTYKANIAREDMGNGCKMVELGENVIIARTEVLKRFPWDNQLTNAEHEDFYLSLKGHVNVASCSWFKVLHKRPGLGDYAGYFEDRDLKPNQDRLCKKWDLKGFNMQYTEWQRSCPT